RPAPGPVGRRIPCVRVEPAGRDRRGLRYGERRGRGRRGHGGRERAHHAVDGLWFAGRPVTHDAAARGPGGLFGARGHRATPTGAYRTQVAGETGRPLLAVLLGRWPSREGSCRAHRARTLPFRASRASRASGASRDAFGRSEEHTSEL